MKETHSRGVYTPRTYPSKVEGKFFSFKKWNKFQFSLQFWVNNATVSDKYGRQLSPRSIAEGWEEKAFYNITIKLDLTEVYIFYYYQKKKDHP